MNKLIYEIINMCMHTRVRAHTHKIFYHIKIKNKLKDTKKKNTDSNITYFIMSCIEMCFFFKIGFTPKLEKYPHTHYVDGYQFP